MILLQKGSKLGKFGNIDCMVYRQQMSPKNDLKIPDHPLDIFKMSFYTVWEINKNVLILQLRRSLIRFLIPCKIKAIAFPVTHTKIAFMFLVFYKINSIHFN